jgi:hypothetical protein
MKKFLASAALIVAVAAPAGAQSFDPSVGSGNLAPRAAADNPLNAYAQQQLHMEVGRRHVEHAVRPYTADEKALFRRVPIE